MGKQRKQIPKCKQCGLCCLVLTPNGYEDCKFLLHYLRGTSADKKTRCMIYQHRVYVINGNHQYCTLRDKLNINFPGCPYNKEGQEMHPKYKNEK